MIWKKMNNLIFHNKDVIWRRRRRPSVVGCRSSTVRRRPPSAVAVVVVIVNIIIITCLAQGSLVVGGSKPIKPIDQALTMIYPFHKRNYYKILTLKLMVLVCI